MRVRARVRESRSRRLLGSRAGFQPLTGSGQCWPGWREPKGREGLCLPPTPLPSAALEPGALEPGSEAPAPLQCPRNLPRYRLWPGLSTQSHGPPNTFDTGNNSHELGNDHQTGTWDRPELNHQGLCRICSLSSALPRRVPWARSPQHNCSFPGSGGRSPTHLPVSRPYDSHRPRGPRRDRTGLT